MKLLSADDFRSEAKDGGIPDGTVYRFATGEPMAVDGMARTKRFVFSDATIDHAGDSIDPKGWDLGIFRSNPVALFAHDSSAPPIGRASNVGVEKGQLVGDIEFASADVYEFADTIYRLVDGGFMKAVSVGFKPKEWAFTNDKARPYGIDFKKQTLLEISICPVPCNPNALSEARSMGMDTSPLREWAEKVLDSGDMVFLPRKELEMLRKQSGAIERRYYLQVGANTTPKQAETMRAGVKRWMDDPSEVLVLGEGVTLRAVGDVAIEADTKPATDEASAESLEDQIAGLQFPKSAEEIAAFGKTVADIIAKAGRRVSAATKAKLQEAMGHHDAMGKCIKDLIDGDGSDDETSDDPDAQPPGTVVLESTEDLSPEELRIKEVRALRESIPTND